jgi:hypothetical protein
VGVFFLRSVIPLISYIPWSLITCTIPLYYLLPLHPLPSSLSKTAKVSLKSAVFVFEVHTGLDRQESLTSEQTMSWQRGLLAVCLFAVLTHAV